MCEILTVIGVVALIPMIILAVLLSLVAIKDAIKDLSKRK